MGGGDPRRGQPQIPSPLFPRVVAAVLTAALVVGPLSARSAPPVPTAQMIIIDTDVGDDIDDAFALAWALSRRDLDVVAITTAWGDTSLRARMVRRMLAVAGRSDIPVGVGSPTATTTPFTQARWADAGPADPAAQAALDLMIRTIRAHPGQITLAALAPLTNVGALIDRDPQTFAKLKGVVLMGGSIRRGYNRGNGAVPNLVPDAEYNALCDAASLRKLLASGVPVAIFPLDSTQIKYQEVDRDRLFGAGSGVADMLAVLYHQWRLNNAWGQSTPTLFDIVPLAFALSPGDCPVQPLRITVSDDGRTREAPGPANASVCLTSNPEPILTTMTNDLLAATGTR